MVINNMLRPHEGKKVSPEKKSIFVKCLIHIKYLKLHPTFTPISELPSYISTVSPPTISTKCGVPVDELRVS